MLTTTSKSVFRCTTRKKYYMYGRKKGGQERVCYNACRVEGSRKQTGCLRVPQWIGCSVLFFLPSFFSFWVSPSLAGALAFARACVPLQQATRHRPHQLSNRQKPLFVCHQFFLSFFYFFFFCIGEQFFGFLSFGAIHKDTAGLQSITALYLLQAAPYSKLVLQPAPKKPI